ncbi:MAG: hypothetical protein VKL01_07400 [Limnothrix sp.]|uniref:hypothetical protein n=1 Tax=unclassified Limnothrix TaxID=2632864 RepID=UPI001304020A|nr:MULTISPECIES: hypothetical protein [unclassified Limnothrix]MEB3118176.1 hypothetical protein [Limnothrix sp.]MBD2159202.1 hypothetical protein [Limnothrix sp. FACHB-1083]MBD2191907.1 hypothetical protein [Limnothrix sp. FACHB-1088]MBD2554459.1 hypothetical protein [Limnothrix sp. FACHB-708]MBD2589443.1 hypothetical protein [Limnothrix sp. FACHB-406]
MGQSFGAILGERSGQGNRKAIGLRSRSHHSPPLDRISPRAISQLATDGDRRKTI